MRPLMEALQLAAPPVDFLYSPWGVDPRRDDRLHALRLAPAARRLLADRPGADRSRRAASAPRPGASSAQIILPAAMPALLAGGSLCLLLTVNEFGIVLFIGAKGVITLPLLVYDKAIQEFDYTTACVIAVINVVLSLSLYSASIAPCSRGSEAPMLVWSVVGPRSRSGSSSRCLIGRLCRAHRCVILLASLAGQWNGVLPSELDLRHITARRCPATRASDLRVSLVTGARWRACSRSSCGTWAALALRAHAARARRQSLSCFSSFRARCRRSRSVSACWSRSAGRRSCSTARSRSCSSRISSWSRPSPTATCRPALRGCRPNIEQVAASLGARPALSAAPGHPAADRCPI